MKNQNNKPTKLLRFLAVVTFLIPLSLLRAAPPTEGVVVEGVLVPGIVIGDSKALVEASYGSPDYCQGPLQDFCTYQSSGVGSVFVRYVGPDGATATGTADDIVHSITWYGFPQWITLSGITTEIALANPQAVIDAYNGGDVVYNNFGQIYAVRDPELGINVIWNRDFYTGRVNVSMQIASGSITNPPTPEPEPEIETISVSDLTLVKRRTNLVASVFVVDADGATVSKAAVSIIWTFPNGETATFSANTNRNGKAVIKVPSSRGTHTVSVDSVSKSGYEFDTESSVDLSESITVKR